MWSLEAGRPNGVWKTAARAERARPLGGAASGASVMAHVRKLPALVAALDRLLLREADAVDVELVVERVRLERRPLLRQQRVRRRGVRQHDRRRRAQHREVVLRVTLEILLPER